MRVRRLIQQLVIGTLVLTVLFVLAGVVYALYNDRSDPVQIRTKTASTEVDALAFKHNTPSLNAPESVAVQGLTTPVSVGGKALINIQTLAGSVCTIQISYMVNTSSKASLAEHKADEFGAVLWEWSISKTAPIGSWPIQVTCVYHNRSAVVAANLQINK